MQEQDLIEAYRKRLEYYQKKFDRDRIFPFTEIKIKEGGEKKIPVDEFLNFYTYDTILIPDKFLEISDEIIDFAALISFLPVEFRSDYLVKLIFLLQFKNSEKSLMKGIWNDIIKYVSGTMIKIVFIDSYLHYFLKQITLNSFLFDFTSKLNPLYIEDEFIAIFIKWLEVVYSKQINIGTMRDIITSSSDLRSFNDFLAATKEIYEKYSISTSLLMRNYSKIGLNHFFVWIKFNNFNKSQEILEKFFYKVPFFTNFFFINRICQFSCFIPTCFKAFLINFLNILQDLKIINNFYFDLVIESSFKLEFENSLKREQNIFEIIPFTSKKFRQNKSLPFNLNKLPELALVKYHQTYQKPILKIDSTFNALDFYIFFEIGNILLENESVHNQLKKKLLISTIQNLTSKQIKKTYYRFFSDNLIQTNKKIPINEFEKLIREKYQKKKSIEQLITLFKVLKISNTSELTKNFFEKYQQKIGNEFNRYFSNGSAYSMKELKEKFNLLIEEGYLKRFINFSVIIMMNPNLIYLCVISNSTLELIKCIFQRAIWMCEKSYNYEFLLTTDTYLLFSKFLLQDNLLLIGIPYLFRSSFIGFDVVSFFDFEKRDWDEKKFNKYIQSFLKTTSYTKNSSRLKIDFGKCDNKIPIFQFADFIRDLRIFNKLNEISKNSSLNRKKIIEFFRYYFQNQKFNFSLITDKFNFNEKRVEFSTLEKKKLLFVIISQLGISINPFILKKTRVFSFLFSEILQNGWYYGGSLDNILILEYIIGREDIRNKESEWNVGIKALKARYPSLNIKIFELHEDLRFFSEQSLFSNSWYYDDFNYLKQTINLGLDEIEVKNEISFIFDSKIRYKEYCVEFLPWEFWQIIGYPVSVSIIVECPKEDFKLIKKVITRLPAGQIFSLKMPKNNKNLTIIAIIQLKNQLDRFYENIIPSLKNLNCKYFVSLIIPLSLYGEKFITKK